MSSEGLGDFFLRVFGETAGADLELPPREPHEPIDLREEALQDLAPSPPDGGRGLG